MPNYPAKVSALELREVGDEILVHDSERGQVHVLNATAGWVLRSCDGNRSIEEIAEALAETTSAEASRVLQDVDQIISEFGRIGVVTFRPSASGESQQC